MTEKSHLPVGIKTRFLFRAARSLPDEYPTSVSHMTPMTCFNGPVPVIAGDKTDTRMLKSVNLTNLHFVCTFSGVPRNFVRGVSTNSVEDRGQRERE